MYWPIVLGFSTPAILLVIWILGTNRVIKPHVGRDGDGRFFVRHYSLDSDRYLDGIGWTNWRNRDKFDTLEDATQAYDDYANYVKELEEKRAKEKARRKGKKVVQWL